MCYSHIFSCISAAWQKEETMFPCMAVYTDSAAEAAKECKEVPQPPKMQLIFHLHMLIPAHTVCECACTVVKLVAIGSPSDVKDNSVL